MKFYSNYHVLHFLRNKRYFADLFNTTIFEGEPIIDPDTLIEMDSVYDEMIGNTNMVRIRDLVMKTEDGLVLAVLGIEHQSYVDYSQGIRNMQYDGLEYAKQIKEIEQTRKQAGPSKLKKEEKLLPVITLTFYTGEKEWDGPMDLKDSLILNEKIRPYVNGYRVYLISFHHIDTYRFREEGMRKAFKIIHEFYQGKFTEMKGEEYMVDEATKEFIIAATRSQKLKKYINKNKTESGEYNMCIALDNYGKQIARDVAARVKKNVTESVTKSVTESVTRSVTEKVTKEVEKEVTKKVRKETIKEQKQTIIATMIKNGIDNDILLKSGFTQKEINQVASSMMN